VNLYLDIETIPAQRPDVLDEIRASEQATLEAALLAVKPPSNYGADAAAKWMNEKGNAQRAALIDAFEATVDEAYRKTGLDGAYGQVCVLGWAFDSEKPAFLSGLEEAALLRNFAAVLRDDLAPSDLHSTTVIGHNVASFDLRFLAQRSIIHGIRPHLVIARAAQAKPWETEKVFDTMVQWAGPGGRVKLDKLCKVLGIQCKGDLDGSKVWDYVKAGRLDEVAAYCVEDVERVRALHRRMTFQTVAAKEFEDVPA
jgi:hypothetical protein